MFKRKVCVCVCVLSCCAPLINYWAWVIQDAHRVWKAQAINNYKIECSMESYDRPLTSFLLYYYVYSMGQMENQSEEDVVCEKPPLDKTRATPSLLLAS